MPFSWNGVFAGSIVKGNGPMDREVKTYIRQPNGLLTVVDEILKSVRLTSADLKEIIVEDIKRLAAAGRPMTLTGQSGLCERREELSVEVRSLSKHRLNALTTELLDEARVGKSIAPGSTIPKWLDVPGLTLQLGAKENSRPGSIFMWDDLRPKNCRERIPGTLRCRIQITH